MQIGYSSEVADAFISLGLHSDTIELARTLIDEIQKGGKPCSHTSNLPPVLAFQKGQKQKKESVP